MLNDLRGLALTTESDAAVAHYDEAIDNYFQYRLKTGKCVKQALEVDPGFAMAHCLQGYLFMLFGTNAVLDKARAALEAARERGADRITAREGAHIAALGTWVEGDMEQTCAPSTA